MSRRSTFLARLRGAGADPGDSEDLRLQKSLLFFATGLITLASMVWLLIYRLIGPQYSSTLPFGVQLLLVGNLLVYVHTLNFRVFRATQLGLFLIIPFVAQWSIGSFTEASGISLWALLAPIGAVIFVGPRQSVVWFLAYVALTVASGGVEYYLVELWTTRAESVSAQTSTFFFALNFGAMSTIVYLLLRHSDSEKHRVQERLREAHRLLQCEQERSQRLLLNVLPGAVAERLKNSDQPIADGFPEVSVMFADIVDFTRVAEGLTPQQVFAMLNKIFSCFDELAESFGLEKIKTIGDAYMVAGGLDGSGHCLAALADMALAICAVLQHDFSVNDRRLAVRIGIASGPVVAGVVGKKKFIYDLWGDTVNIASRVTTEAIPGIVQVDARSYQCLRPDFVFHQPRTIQVKGKGNMVVYGLIGRRTSAVDQG